MARRCSWEALLPCWAACWLHPGQGRRAPAECCMRCCLAMKAKALFTLAPGQTCAWIPDCLQNVLFNPEGTGPPLVGPWPGSPFVGPPGGAGMGRMSMNRRGLTKLAELRTNPLVLGPIFLPLLQSPASPSGWESAWSRQVMLGWEYETSSPVSAGSQDLEAGAQSTAQAAPASSRLCAL